MSIVTKKQIIVIVFMFFLVIACAAVTYSIVSPQGYFADIKNDLKSIEPETEYSYTDLDGNVVDMKDFRGRILVVNAWATWMPFSKNELEALAELSNAHSDTVLFIAINRMEKPAVIRAYLNAMAITNPPRILIDSSDHFYTAVGGYSMPETLIYNKEGVLIEHVRGPFDIDILRSKIAELVAMY